MSVDALSPLDGRYFKDLGPLRSCFSESALIQRRLQVEIRYLRYLLSSEALKAHQEAPAQDLHLFLEDLESRQSELVQDVKTHEAQTRHDVKAVEYALADQLRQNAWGEWVNWLHWGLTSEDVNNLAYALMLQQAYQEAMLPALRHLVERLAAWIEQSADVPMLARTHGQAASPTTVGKEYAVFAQRLLEGLQELEGLLPPGGKLNGATGNWHVFQAFFPEQDWPDFSAGFIRSLGLKPEVRSTQIVMRESYARLFDANRRINQGLIDMARDSWQYVSLGYFKLQRRSEKEVGSSTMPHKINPVMFENAEGNLELGNALLSFFSDKLLKSRLQRDLSDSTTLRNMGVALGHSYLGVLSLQRGLQQLAPSEQVLEADLNAHWEVLAELLQHQLRLEQREVPYDLIRKHTQGLHMSQDNWRALLDELGLALPIQHPRDYTGLAARQAHETTRDIRRYLNLD